MRPLQRTELWRRLPDKVRTTTIDICRHGNNSLAVRDRLLWCRASFPTIRLLSGSAEVAAYARSSGSSLSGLQPCPFRHRLLDTIQWKKGPYLVAVAALVAVVAIGGPCVGGSQR